MNNSSIGKKFIPLYPTSLVKQITEFLTNAIVEGQLKSGQRLSEADLQRTYKVSRAPIRESFRFLERDGLVVTIPQRGTFVRMVTQRYFEENFPIRALLESFAARSAISNFRSEDIETMELALRKMEQATDVKDFRSYLKYHFEFHEVFISASKNETLIAILKNLTRQYIWFRSSYMALSYVQESIEYHFQVHREILNLFARKDTDRVERLVKEHILTAGNRFLEVLTSKGRMENIGVLSEI
jgi:DNA-binding GntR family transcriptional regulator